MYVVCVRIEVIPEQVDAFLDATFTHARATRQEPGNVRFDVLQHNEDPSRFCLYEAYRDRESFLAHQQSPHYLTWRPTVAPFMAAPRVGDQYRSLFPDPWE